MTYVSGGNELLSVPALLKQLDLKAGQKIADLGCGRTGYFVFPAAKLVGGPGLVYAVDILKSVLQLISSRAREEGLDNIRTIWSNLEIYGAAKISADSLDAALLINTLFQTKEDKTVMKEAIRLLKKGGKLLVVDWNQAPMPFGPPIIDRVKEEGVRRIAKELDLKLIQSFAAGPYHFGLVFEK